MGREINDPVLLEGLDPKVTRGTLKGKVVRIDRFGNLITNISRNVFNAFTKGKGFIIRVTYLPLNGIARAYHGGKDGELMALFGSSGWLEISVKNWSARDLLKAGKGEEVAVTGCEWGRCRAV